MLSEIGGTFVKIAFASEADMTLLRRCTERPPARFNRPGQDALYLSPDEESARVGIGEYVKEGDPPRVLLRFEVERCQLVDLRHCDAAPLYALAGQPWRRPLAAGIEPNSWRAADQLRRAGHAGLIDPSRRRPGLWHITLFRWNEPGAPKVMPVGRQLPITVALDYR